MHADPVIDPPVSSVRERSQRHVMLIVSSMGAGGAERVAATLCNVWVARGDRVTLVATYSKPCQSFYPLDSRVNFVSLAALPGIRGLGPIRDLSRFLALRRLIGSEAPDVLLSFLTVINVATIIASRGLNLPLVVTEHTYPPSLRERWAIEYLRRLLYPLASGVVMLTSEGRDWVNREIPRASTYVVPNPIEFPLPVGDPTIEVDRLVPGTASVLMSAGRFDAGKQFHHLIEAFAPLHERHPDWMLVIFGDGPERPKLERLIRALGLDGAVLLPGRAGNLGEWFARAELFALTSRWEGFSMVIAEALSYGCPAVSYDCDVGPRDMIEHGRNGLLVPPDEGVQGLIAAIGGLMDDDARRSSMASVANGVLRQFSVDAVAGRWDVVFEHIRATARPADEEPRPQ